MTLYLIRHAKAEKEAKSGRDFDRKLSEKGRKQAKKLGELLKYTIPENTRFFCSSAKRTRETITLSELTNEVHFLDELYLASETKLVQFVNALNAEHPICLIGHNEGISELASYFTGQTIELRTSEFIVLRFPFESSAYWSQETAQIDFQGRPEVD